MLVCVRLRHVDVTQWGGKKYMYIRHVEIAAEDIPITG